MMKVLLTVKVFSSPLVSLISTKYANGLMLMIFASCLSSLGTALHKS